MIRVRPVPLLAVVATGTAISMSVLAGWQRGGWLAERLVWVLIGVVLVAGAHLLPALCRSAPLSGRVVGAVLWLGCMAAASYGYATFFLLSQLHAGELRVSAIPVASVPVHRELTAVMADRASVTAELARADARRCTRDCPTWQIRRTSLAARLDALDAEAADVRRYQTIEDGNAERRVTARGDPVTARLATFCGIPETRLDLFAGLVFAAALALMVQYCNEAIEKIKQEGNSEGFRDWLAEIERQPKANEGRLLSLVDACLSVNHHLLVLRFDLGYGQLYSDRELSGEMAVSYEEMREHRVALRRYLKRYLKDRLPPGACKGMAFSIKLEYGLDKGYHFHVIVILNGDVVGKDAGITEMICHQWKCAITMSKGGACNCNQRLYKRKGIGSIRYWETEKLGILRKVVVPYVTKVDFYGKMVKPDGHRTFWPSYPPKIEAKPRGRKRKNGEAE